MNKHIKPTLSLIVILLVMISLIYVSITTPFGVVYWITFGPFMFGLVLVLLFYTLVLLLKIYDAIFEYWNK